MKKIYRVSNMHCASCVMKLESLEDELAGVQRIEASYRTQKMEVEFDLSRISEAQIMAAVERRGYHIQEAAQK